MRFAIFSDIHSNLEALEAVLADARQRRCTHFISLGDVVGYTYQRMTVCSFGNTHVPMVFVRDDGVRRHNAEHIRIEHGKKYFINAASVGQPRDANWRAGYCIYDVENNLVELLRAKYDLATAQKKISKAGLPRLLSERLAMGR